MKRLLIANRGEIARRVMRTAHVMGMETVAVYSDADAQALHVGEATAAYALGGNASADSYLRIDKMIEAARATGADAVHPGYGFLSENADFAQAVVDAGLIWVGPPAAAIRAVGSKSGAKLLARAQSVPCLEGYQGEDQSGARFAAEAAKTGFPVMVKAVAGGGGRGMRLAMGPGQLAAALQSARSEAQSSFGNGELLIERALLNPRHVEVQIFADTHGNCIHLGERDCSVQRRHQKLVEESPSPAVDATLRARMGAYAVALAKAAGYEGAGTVEFLLDGHGDAAQVFLMEMNTRLQVEHPVTEAITGQDLVAWQLRVAQGEPLPLSQAQVDALLRDGGHAIEVRLCAEDEQYTPHAGTVTRFTAPDGVRFDHALHDGAVVPPYYDSMLGKLIAHAPTRAQAINSLLGALARTQVLGLPTNRAFLGAVLQSAEFRAGEALIPFLGTHAEGLRAGLQVAQAEHVVVFALAALFGSGTGGLPSPFARPVRLRHRGDVLAMSVRELGAGAVEVSMGDAVHRAHVSAQDDAVCVTIGAMRHAVSVVAAGVGRWHLQTGAVEIWLEDASFEPAARAGGVQGSAELRAPFNGKVIALPAAIGQAVKRGDTVAVIESMKLEHALAAPRDAVIAGLVLEVGQQVATGQVLVRFGEVAP